MHVGFANPQWRGKRSRHSRRMHNPQFYVSGKRPMVHKTGTTQGLVVYSEATFKSWMWQWMNNGNRALIYTEKDRHHVTTCQSCTLCHRMDLCGGTVYPRKYAHGFIVLGFVVVMQSFIMSSHEVFIHIHQGCFAGTGAIVRLPQCQWSKPDGYGKISQCITTTKHSKAKTVSIFLGIYCRCIVINSIALVNSMNCVYLLQNIFQ